MPRIYAGQVVRIKDLEELKAEYGFTDSDIGRNLVIGGISLEQYMLPYLGKTYMVLDFDTYDNTMYLDCTRLWWPSDMVELVSGPNEYFGFKTGDEVEFRNYTDLCREYDIDDIWFTEDMKYLCGSRGKITSIEPENGMFAEITMVDSNGEVIEGWTLNTAMIEHVDDSPDVQLDDWALMLS